jgi:hypothetical protein
MNSGRTNPELWELSKLIALIKFDNKHSARAMQFAGKIYRDLGGEYTSKLSPSQLSLKKWTDEDWDRDIENGRYLPKKIREQLTPEEYLKTSIKKIKGTKEGRQYVAQPKKIIERIKEIKGGEIPHKKIGKYTYYISNKPEKKLMTNINNKWIYFGQNPFQHFKDKTGLLPIELNHLDKERQRKYLNRSRGIRNKEGELTKDDPMSPNYHAIRILWE